MSDPGAGSPGRGLPEWLERALLEQDAAQRALTGTLTGLHAVLDAVRGELGRLGSAGAPGGRGDEADDARALRHDRLLERLDDLGGAVDDVAEDLRRHQAETARALREVVATDVDDARADAATTGEDRHGDVRADGAATAAAEEVTDGAAPPHRVAAVQPQVGTRGAGAAVRARAGTWWSRRRTRRGGAGT